MTGTTAKTRGDRVFKEHLEMDPALPTMPQVFRDAEYQAFAVGKLHVYPQRDRIGFDEVILCAVAPARALPPEQLDGARDVPRHPAPGPPRGRPFGTAPSSLPIRRWFRPGITSICTIASAWTSPLLMRIAVQRMAARSGNPIRGGYGL